MTEITESVDVKVPIRVAYDQWTQFESFPEFMEGVQEVRQVDDTHLHWRADVAGRQQEWDAEITSQVPDQHIAWRSTEGFQNTGDVRFEPLGESETRVVVRMSHEPEGAVERAADAVGLVRRRVRGDLERFRDLIESRQEPTGAWRGQVRDGDVVGGAAAATAGGVAADAGQRDDDEPRLGPEGYSEGTRLPRMSAIKGADVCDRDGDKIGTVQDLYLDANHEYVRYLEVKTGWTGRSAGIVPIDDADFREDDGDTVIVVPYTKEQIRQAPTLGDDDELTPDREQEIYRHYERSGYWEEARSAIASRQTTPAPTPEIARAEVADAMDRGEDPGRVRVKRWGI